jgi:hypothetical protein
MDVVQRRGGLAFVVVSDGPQFREFRARTDPFGSPAEEITAPAAVQEAGSAIPQPAAAAQDIREPDLSFESFFPEGHLPTGPVDPVPM